MLSFCVFAVENDSDDTNHNFFASVYFTDSIPVGTITDYIKFSAGHGLTAGYTFSAIPLNLNLRLEFAQNPLSDKKTIDSWNHLVMAAGVSYSINALSFLTIKPALDFGFLNNYITLKNENELSYMDLAVQFSLGMDFYSQSMKSAGIAFSLSPFYRLLLEKSNLGQYAGLQTGIIFLF